MAKYIRSTTGVDRHGVGLLAVVTAVTESFDMRDDDETLVVDGSARHSDVTTNPQPSHIFVTVVLSQLPIRAYSRLFPVEIRRVAYGPLVSNILFSLRSVPLLGTPHPLPLCRSNHLSATSPSIPHSRPSPALQSQKRKLISQHLSSRTGPCALSFSPVPPVPSPHSTPSLPSPPPLP